MTIFVSTTKQYEDHKPGNALMKGCGLSVEECWEFARLEEHKNMQIRFIEPELKNILKQKTIPRILIPETVIKRLNVVLVPEKYLPVLCWRIKEELYLDYGKDKVTDEGRKKCEIEIRAKLIQLLTSGEWIDHPESPEVENLNNLMRKIDRGRRTDLNYSSEQSEESRYKTKVFSHVVARERKKDLEELEERRRAIRRAQRGAAPIELEETPFQRYKRLNPDL